MKKVLIVTNSGDIHSDDLVRACKRLEVGCFRYNTDHVRTRGHIESHSSNDTTISIDSHSINLSEVGLLVYRRPLDVTPAMLENEIEPWIRSFINSEWGFFERALPDLIGCKTINHPSANLTAQNKVAQQAIAKRCGLLTPHSLVSNKGATLSEFAANQPTVTKAIGNGSHLYASEIRSGYTQTATAETFPTELNPFTISLAQEAIKPIAMWRIVTIGTRCIGFRMTGSQLDNETDSRRVEEKLDGEVSAVPEKIQGGLQAMMENFSIVYASSDFIEDREGKLWFIDLNPEGQWGAYEQRFGVPISEFIIGEIET